MMKQKICIIGDGITGLITAISLSQYNLDIDLYITHPREDLSYIQDMLKPSIQIISLEQDIELFLNNLSVFRVIQYV